jgi:hypothetical protein
VTVALAVAVDRASPAPARAYKTASKLPTAIEPGGGERRLQRVGNGRVTGLKASTPADEAIAALPTAAGKLPHALAPAPAADTRGDEDRGGRAPPFKEDS